MSLPLYNEALQDYQAGKFDTAKDKLRKVILESPAFEDAYEALSVILYNQKLYDEAISVIKCWIRVNPDSIMSHTNLSRCYMSKNMILEAEQEQSEARRLTWKADLKAKKMEMPKVNLNEQIERYKKVIEFDPDDVLGYFSLGNAYLESGNKRDAVDTLEKGLRINPNHSASYLSLGLALEALGDIERAKKIYRDGMGVANNQGDMMTERKMQSRVEQMENSKGKNQTD